MNGKKFIERNVEIGRRYVKEFRKICVHCMEIKTKFLIFCVLMHQTKTYMGRLVVIDRMLQVLMIYILDSGIYEFYCVRILNFELKYYLYDAR